MALGCRQAPVGAAKSSDRQDVAVLDHATGVGAANGAPAARPPQDGTPPHRERGDLRGSMTLLHHALGVI